MKARIEREALRKALKTVTPAISRGNLAVLNGVRIDATSGLRFTCTDLQQTIIVDEAANVMEPGSAVVPASLFARFVDRLPAGSVELVLDDGRLHVQGGDATLALWCLPVEEWPLIESTDGASFTLTAEHVDSLRRILPMASIDQARPILTGLNTNGDQAACTDSWRLGVARLPGATLPPAIIPAEAMTNALKTADGAVTLTVGQRSASVRHSNATWQTVLIEGEFPSFERLIPKGPPHVLTFNVEALVDAVTTAGVLGGVDAKGNRAPVKVHRDGDKASVSATRQDVGTADQVIPCDGDFDPPIGFNPEFLAAMVTATGLEDVTLHLTDELKPVVAFTDELTLLCMPVRLA